MNSIQRLSIRRSASVFTLLAIMLLLAACGRNRSEESSVVVPTPIPDTAAAPTEAATEAPTPVAETDSVTNTDTVSETATISETASTSTVPLTETVTADAQEPHIFFRQPTNNAIVPITSTVIMSATGVAIAPAGDVVEGSGHFHILVDVDFVAAGEVIPNDVQHRHFGDGSTTTEIGLPVGSHTLRLQFADGAHRALEGDQYRDEIVVSVVDGAPEQAVRFAMPSEGATTPPQVDVVMAASGLIVEPAGPLEEGAGHMHILVDTDFVAPGEVIVKDEQHLHFGSGQLTTTLELAPGAHTLRLQFADGAHIALEGDQYRDEININVAEDAVAQQVQIVEPAHDAEVTSPVLIRMTAAGLIVEPAGLVLRGAGGHMHILVDTDFIAPGEVIIKDDQHIHFGGGQLQTELELAPGAHTLRLQMANGAHIALEGDQYRDEISIIVK